METAGSAELTKRPERPSRRRLPGVSRRQDLLTGALALAALVAFGLLEDPALRLALLTAATVFAMSVVHRTPPERWITAAASARGLHLELRHYLFPAAALLTALRLDLVESERALVVTGEKLPIVLLILVFGVLAEGLKDSRYFEWAALRASRRGRGDTQRLLLNLFLVMAVLTIVTSNDIMVFAFTPLVIAIMAASGISNATVALLILFIAANTSSMALYLGSPTNIILSQAVDVSPFTYTFIMLVPTVVSLLATLIVVEAVNRGAFRPPRSGFGPVRAFLAPLHLPATYVTLQPGEPITQDAEMRRWTRAFVVAVLVVFTFGFVSSDLRIPVLIIAIVALVAVRTSTRTRLGSVLRRLPLQLVPFALTFFVVADAFGRTATFLNAAPGALTAALDLSNPLAALQLVGASGLSVNVFNDLPASALWGEVLNLIEAEGVFDAPGGRMRRILALQSILVGVNIGTYLTPFGALAGIIWLNQMAVEGRERNGTITVPRIGHLVAYGGVMFIVVGVVTSLSIIAPLAMLDVLLSAPGEPATAGLDIATLGIVRWLVLMVPSTAVIVLLIVQSVRVLRRTRLMDDVRQWLLPVSSALRRIILRSELTYRVAVVIALVLIMGGLIQWVELTHARWHGSDGFATGGGFFSWFLIFVGSGEPVGDIFPTSWLGAVLAGLLPISALGGLVIVTRVPSGKWERRVRDQIARGVIPAKRIVFVGFQAHHGPLVRQLRGDDTTFVLIIADPDELAGATGFVEHAQDSRIHVVEATRGATPLLEEFNLVPSLRYDPPLLIVFGAHRTGSNVESLRALSELCRPAGAPGSSSRQVATTVIFECSSEDEYQRTAALRDRLAQSGYALVPVYAHRDYAALLVADLAADLDGLARNLGLIDDDARDLPLFRRPVTLVPRALTTGEVDVLASGGEQRLGVDVLGVIATVGGHDAVFTAEDFMSLAIDEDARRATPRSAIVMRGAGAVGDVEADADLAGSGTARPAPLLVVVNDTARAREFIARARRADPQRRIRLVTAQAPNAVLHAGLDVSQAGSAVEAAERTLIDGDTLLPVGARIFVFLREGEDHASEGWTLEFLQAFEQLQTRILQSGVGPDPVSHADLYVAVESRVHGEHGYEFVHNQLAVDSVFDPSIGERSIFTAIAHLVAQLGLPETQRLAAAALTSFAQAASGLSNLEAQPAEAPTLFADDGLRDLVGRRADEVVATIAEHAFPPRRLISILRPAQQGDVTVLVPIADGPEEFAGVVVERRDLLLLLPTL